MPRREYQSSCVCVPPGGPPEGILDIAEYIVCLVVFLLFLFGPQNFFRRKLKFFGEKTHVAKKFVSFTQNTQTSNIKFLIIIHSSHAKENTHIYIFIIIIYK